MAYSKLYERINFVNESEGKTTPLGAVNMNKLDYAVDALDDRVVELDRNKLEKSSVDSFVANISFDKESGELTVEKVNSPSEKIDLGTDEIMEKINDVSEEVEDLNQKTNEIIENLGIKNTASGETIHVTDSADAKVVEFGLYGKAEQKQYSGKNRLNNTATDTTSADVSFVVNEDKSITANGTSSGWASTSIYPCTLEAGTYILSGCPSSGGSGKYVLYIPSTYLGTEYVDSGNGVEFTLTETKTFGVGAVVYSGYTANNLVFKPMIRLASIEDATYEPYVGGVASPNPDYPQEIDISGESYNLLDVSTITSGYPNATSGASIDDIVTSTRYAHSEVIEITEPVTIQWKANSGLDYLRFHLYKNDIWQSQINLDIASDGTYTLPKSDSYDKMMLVVGTTSAIGTWDNSYLVECQIEYGTEATRYMPYGQGSIEVKSVGKNLWNPESMATNESGIERPGIVVESGTYTITNNSGNVVYCRDGNGTATSIQSKSTLTRTFNSEGVIWTSPSTSDVQVEEGLVATPYQPYKEPTTSLISTPEGLASVGGVYDEIIKYADGSGKRIQRIGKAVLDENSVTSREAFDSNGNGGRINLIQLTDFKPYTGSKANLLCSHYQSKSGDETYLHREGMVIISNGLIRVWDSRYTEGIEEYKTWIASNNVTVLYELAEPIITDLTTEEIAEIEKLHTFYPVTNISNDAGCNMAFKYLCDSKNYIDNKFALIEAAMVNNI